LGYRAAFFTFTLATFYWTSLEALPIFFSEREIFMREYSRGAYRASSYTIATWIIGFPVLIILASMYAVMTWWLVGLPPIAERFFFFAFQCFIALLAGQTLATMLSTVMPNPMTAQTVGSTIFAIMLTFSGYFIHRDAMPKYWYCLIIY
jgi:ATP-binding cassette subfamily G (WHITE) protein 2